MGNFTLILLAVFFILSSNQSFAQFNLQCGQQKIGEKSLSRSDIKIAKNISEANEIYLNVYNRPHRLKNRFFWSPTSESFLALNNNGHVIPVDSLFIKNLILKIETALKLKYANFLYYGDLGHAHILIPEDVTQPLLSLALQSTQTQLLFHTAELFQFRQNSQSELTPDPWMQWRYYSRNFVTKNNSNSDLSILFEAPPAPYNTVRSLAGFKQIATVYFSANSNGCFIFNYKDVTYNFDISFTP